jgi:hypothetical protein
MKKENSSADDADERRWKKEEDRRTEKTENHPQMKKIDADKKRGQKGKERR